MHCKFQENGSKEFLHSEYFYKFQSYKQSQENLFLQFDNHLTAQVQKVYYCYCYQE